MRTTKITSATQFIESLVQVALEGIILGTAIACFIFPLLMVALYFIKKAFKEPLS